MTEKERNKPGVKDDAQKLNYELIPPEAIKGLAQVLTFGANKYTRNGWQIVPDARDRYTGALMRHLEAWRSGEMIDPETGINHMYHVLCNAAFLGYFDDNNLNP